MINKIKLNPFDGDIAGETNQLEVPLNGNKEVIGVLLRAVGDNNGSPATFSELVTRVGVEIDSKEKIEILPDLYEFANSALNISGDTTAPNVLAVKFASPIAAGSALGTSNVGQMLINCEIKANAGNVTYSKMVATLIYRANVNKTRGAIIRDKVYKHTRAVEGENVIDDLPVQSLDVLSMLVFDDANIESVEVLHDENKIIDITKEDLDAYYSEEPFINNPGFASRFPLRFDDFADITEALPLVKGSKDNPVRIPLTVKYVYKAGETPPATGVPILIRGVENEAKR